MKKIIVPTWVENVMVMISTAKHSIHILFIFMPVLSSSREVSCWTVLNDGSVLNDGAVLSRGPFNPKVTSKTPAHRGGVRVMINC